MHNAATTQEIARRWAQTHVLAPFTDLEFTFLHDNMVWLEIVSQAIDAATVPSEEDALFYMAELGWTWEAERRAFIQRDEDGTEMDLDAESTTWLELADNEFEVDNIEPVVPEVLEWWIVTDSALAALQAANEVVVEFGGLALWGRQTSGQAIHLDSVIERIALAAHNAQQSVSLNLTKHEAELLAGYLRENYKNIPFELGVIGRRIQNELKGAN